MVVATVDVFVISVAKSERRCRCVVRGVRSISQAKTGEFEETKGNGEKKQSRESANPDQAVDLPSRGMVEFAGRTNESLKPSSLTLLLPALLYTAHPPLRKISTSTSSSSSSLLPPRAGTTHYHPSPFLFFHPFPFPCSILFTAKSSNFRFAYPPKSESLTMD